MLEGLDVSHYQTTTPDLTGKDFLFIKATEGTTTDPYYALHYRHARAAGVVVGAYHFGINEDGFTQAKEFLRVAGNANLFALDVEGANPITDSEAEAFIAYVQGTGRKCALYHSLSGFPNYGQDYNWVADYVNTPPPIGWTFWQNGPENGVDHDFFRYGIAELNKLAGIEVPVGPVVTNIMPIAGSLVITKAANAERVSDGALKPVVAKQTYVPIYSGYVNGSPVFGIVKDTTDFIIGATAASFTPIVYDCSVAIAADRAKAHIVYE